MNRNYVHRPAVTQPKTPIQITRAVKNAIPNRPVSKPAPPLDSTKIKSRTYTAKDITKAIHLAHHEAEQQIIKTLEQLPINATEYQIQIVEKRIKEFIAALKRETDNALMGMTKPKKHSEQPGLLKTARTATTKSQGGVWILLKIDKDISSNNISRTPRVGMPNYYTLINESPREASSSADKLTNCRKTTHWGILTPVNSSSERREAFNQIENKQQRLVTPDTRMTKADNSERGHGRTGWEDCESTLSGHPSKKECWIPIAPGGRTRPNNKDRNSRGIYV